MVSVLARWIILASKMAHRTSLAMARMDVALVAQSVITVIMARSRVAINHFIMMVALSMAQMAATSRMVVAHMAVAQMVAHSIMEVTIVHSVVVTHLGDHSIMVGALAHSIMVVVAHLIDHSIMVVAQVIMVDLKDHLVAHLVAPKDHLVAPEAASQEDDAPVGRLYVIHVGNVVTLAPDAQIVVQNRWR